MPRKIRNYPLYKKSLRKGMTRKAAARKAAKHPRKGK